MASVYECPAPNPTPEAAFTCAQMKGGAAERVAFFDLLAAGVERAKPYLKFVAGRPWLADVGFYQAVRLGDTGVLKAVVRKNPIVALREYRTLPREIVLEAVEVAPDLALVLAPEAVRGTRFEPLIGKPARAALLIDAMTLDEAVAVSVDAERFFQRAVRLRQDSRLDRWLEEYAQTAVRTGGAKEFTGEDWFYLLTYGRSELNQDLFRKLFRKATIPSADNRHLLRFLAIAGNYGALERVANVKVLERAFAQIDALEQAVDAAEVADMLPSALRLGVERQIAARPERLYKALAAYLIRKDTGTAALELSAKPLYERYYFYNDIDGVDSYRSFRASYVKDVRWKVEEHGGWVMVSSGRIVIFANVPETSPTEQAEGRNSELSKELGRRGIRPSVVVHRGHSYYAPQTIRDLTSEVKLVFLGSCRGANENVAVSNAAPDAQVIATRNVGTQSVNDPILKALNDYLLTETRVNWDKFWSIRLERLRGSPKFQDYIPPHRNSVALFLAFLRNNQ